MSCRIAPLHVQKIFVLLSNGPPFIRVVFAPQARHGDVKAIVGSLQYAKPESYLVLSFIGLVMFSRSAPPPWSVPCIGQRSRRENLPVAAEGSVRKTPAVPLRPFPRHVSVKAFEEPVDSFWANRKQSLVGTFSRWEPCCRKRRWRFCRDKIITCTEAQAGALPDSCSTTLSAGFAHHLPPPRRR